MKPSDFLQLDVRGKILHKFVWNRGIQTFNAANHIYQFHVPFVDGVVK